MRYIQYSRRSSEGDERQVQSIPDQNAALARLVEQCDLTVVARFEEAKSAKLPYERPIFARMVKMIANGEADAILCWHLNRLSRNPVDSGQLELMLQQGVIQRIKTPEREYRPEDNVVIMAIENAVSNQYIIDLRKNIRRGQDEKAARGWFPYRPPAGYLTHPITKEIDIDPERFPLLRRAWELMLTGGYLVPEVLEKLDAWGYRTHKGPQRFGQSIGRARLYLLFDNPFYCGEFKYRGERSVGRHRPMVTRSEFEQVQSIIHRKSHTQPQKHTFAFTGLFRCGGCGCLVTAERKIKRYPTTGRTVTYVYYRCTRSRPCADPCVTEAYVDGVIQACLDKVQLRLSVAAWAETVLLGDGGRTADWAPALALTYQRNLDQVQSKLDRLLELRMNDELSSEEFRLQKERYLADRRQNQHALERLDDRAQDNSTSLKNGLAFVSKASPAFPKAPEKLKRQIATNLAEAYVLTQGKLHVTVRPLLLQLAALEPPKGGRQQVRQSLDGSPNPQLCSAIDKIRTLLRNTDVAFPHIDFDEQVQLDA
ncbi:MAG: recombinase family protein [Fimbriimonadaceae bacterium]